MPSLLILALGGACVSCSGSGVGFHRVRIAKQFQGDRRLGLTTSGAVIAKEPRSGTEYVEVMGVRIGCDIAPMSDGVSERTVRAGDDVVVRFSVSDTTTNSAITGARPGAWIHPQGLNDGGSCQDKIEAWVAGGLLARAEYDLNEFYVLVLNDEPSISVIDPLFGYGGSKLLSLIELPAVGEDWVLSEDRSRLYVSTPKVNQVVAINTSNWKVVDRIDVGAQPTRIRMQPDGKYLWVSCASIGGESNSIYVVDTDSLKVAAAFGGGNGHHEFAFSPDSLVVFVADAGLARLTIIDTQELETMAVVELERSAGGVVYSPMSRCVYVVDPVGGTVAVVDGDTHKLVRRVFARPGLGTIRLVPGGRYLLVANEQTATVEVVDVASDAIIQSVNVGPEPDQIMFTLSLAYVRSRGSDQVLMMPLEQIGSGEALAVADFTGGHARFGLATTTSLADGIAPAPGGLAAVVANPSDHAVYYYREGMAAPMGSFQTYGREPRAVMVVDRSLSEVSPGEYTTSLKIERPGTYVVAFYLDVPRILHCFDLVVGEGEATLAAAPASAIRIRPLGVDEPAEPGVPVRLRYVVRDGVTGKPIDMLQDFDVLAFSSRNWQKHCRAESVGRGVYEATLVVPVIGVYHVYCQVPSLKLAYQDLPLRVLRVE